MSSIPLGDLAFYDFINIVRHRPKYPLGRNVSEAFIVGNSECITLDLCSHIRIHLHRGPFQFDNKMFSVLGSGQLNVAREHEVDDAARAVRACDWRVNLNLPARCLDVLPQYFGDRLIIHGQVILLPEHPRVFGHDPMKLRPLSNPVFELRIEDKRLKAAQEIKSVSNET